MRTSGYQAPRQARRQRRAAERRAVASDEAERARAIELAMHTRRTSPGFGARHPVAPRFERRERIPLSGPWWKRSVILGAQASSLGHQFAQTPKYYSGMVSQEGGSGGSTSSDTAEQNTKHPTDTGPSAATRPDASHENAKSQRATPGKAPQLPWYQGLLSGERLYALVKNSVGGLALLPGADAGWIPNTPAEAREGGLATKIFPPEGNETAMASKEFSLSDSDLAGSGFAQIPKLEVFKRRLVNNFGINPDHILVELSSDADNKAVMQIFWRESLREEFRRKPTLAYIALNGDSIPDAMIRDLENYRGAISEIFTTVQPNENETKKPAGSNSTGSLRQSDTATPTTPATSTEREKFRQDRENLFTTLSRPDSSDDATAYLDTTTLISTLKSVFLSDRQYEEEYKLELLEAAKNAIERSPGLFRKFEAADIGRLRAAAGRQDLRVECLLRALANQVESCLDPDSGSMDFSINLAGYVSAFLRNKYPQHEFLMRQELTVKIRGEAGHESRSSGLLEALLNRNTVTMEFPSGTPEAIGNFIKRYQRRVLTHEEVVELLEFSQKSNHEEITRRIQIAGSGALESLVTEVKRMLPQYGNILDAVSVRDAIAHERANADESVKSAICQPADPDRLNLQSRKLRLKELEGVIDKEISVETMKLKKAPVPAGYYWFDIAAKDLFGHLEHYAITRSSELLNIKPMLVAHEGFRVSVVRYLVIYLAENELPKTTESQASLKAILEALKDTSTSPQLATSTPAPSTLIRSDDDMAAWFNPQKHTPGEFLDQWVTLQTQRAGLAGDYRNVSIDISYTTTEKHVAGNYVPSFTQKVTKHNARWRLQDIANRQYLKEKRYQGWNNFKIEWPREFPIGLRAKIEGGAWNDFKEFISKFIESDSFGSRANVIHLIAQGVAKKNLDELKEGKNKNRPRMVIYKRHHVTTPLAGAFELDGRIYSIINGKNYPAPKEYKKNEVPEPTIPASLADLVKAGMSENELERVGKNPLLLWRTFEGSKAIFRWPYLTYRECEPGEFSRDMMNRFVKKYEDDMDRTTYSHREQNWDTVADFMEMGLGLVSLPIGAVTGPMVGVGLALLSTVPDVIRMTTADTRKEADNALNAMLLGLVIEGAGQTITPALMKGFQKLVNRKSTKLLQNIRSEDQAPVIRLEDLEDWAAGVQRNSRERAYLSEADVGAPVDRSGGSRTVAGTGNGESWLQSLGYKVSGNYQKPKKVIAKGSIGTIYDIDGTFLRKDYSGILDESHLGRLTKAENTVAAMNRLYGDGAAEVLIWNSPKPLEKIVTVKMKRISGESLDSLLKKGDTQALNEVLTQYRGSDPINELVSNLSKNGIDYNDINLANILFDRKAGKFHMIDFDDAEVKPIGEMLNPGKIDTMRTKFEHNFSEFERSADKIHFKSLDSALGTL